MVQLPAAEDHPTVSVLLLHPGFALKSKSVLHSPLYTSFFKSTGQKSSSSKTEVGDKWTALPTGLSLFAQVACHAPWWGHLTSMQLPQGLHPKPPGSRFFHFPRTASIWRWQTAKKSKRNFRGCLQTWGDFTVQGLRKQI